MDLDLSRAMHDAARVGTAHRPAFAPAPVMQRIRRRRRVRVATESTLGVAAAGALAFGTVQVLDTRSAEPVPPAVTTPTPSPEPSGSLAVVTPTADFACELPVPAIDDPAGDADLHLEPVLRVQTAQGTSGSTSDLRMRPTDGLELDAVLVNGTTGPLEATTSGKASVWFAQDGVVVGSWMTTPEGVPVEDLVGPTGTRWSLTSSGRPTPCADPPTPADGSLPSVTMPTGTYDVHVVQDVQLPGGGTVAVTGRPVPLVIEGEPESPVDVAPDVPPAGVDAHPDPEDLVISPAGLGPLAVGQPPRSNPGAAMIELDPDFCADFTTEPGRWVASGYEPEVRDGEPKPLFMVAADETSVSWIDVLGTTIRTAEGVGVGTTLEDLRATYPSLEGPFDGPVSRVWWLTGPTGTLVFETQGDELGLQPAGTAEQVILMRVLQAGMDPAFATANTDHVAGGCF